VKLHPLPANLTPRLALGPSLKGLALKGLALKGLTLMGLALMACRASVSANASANVDKDGKPIADYDKPLSPKQLDEQGESGGVKYALLGARHDLNYAGEPKEDCRCLAVAAGQPNDARFSWEAAVPVVDQGSQLVVALTSQSIPCAKAKKNSMGASYQGYELDGANVVVVVEEAKAGRPLTAGGIVPKPGAGGALFLRPAEPILPYGKGLGAGEARCRLDFGPQPTAPAADTDDLFTRPYKTKSLKSGEDESAPNSETTIPPPSEERTAP
jgi:hypothetical protein